MNERGISWSGLAFALALAACGGSEFTSSGSGGSPSGGGAAGAGGGGTGAAVTGGTGGSGATGGVAGATGGVAGATGGVAGATGGVAGATGGTGGTSCIDADKDGFTTCQNDCNDNDATSYPGAIEICGDGADNDCDGTPDQICNGIGTYVSQLGNDGDPGTKDQPVLTIAKGMANAKAIMASSSVASQTVYIGEGHYDEKVTLVEGVSLFGGYECNTALPCSWKRDPALFDSAIMNKDETGVIIDATITRATAMDGLRVSGKDGGSSTVPGTVAISIKGGSPTLNNVKVFAAKAGSGSWPYGRAVGIWIESTASGGKGALIQGSKIVGGAQATQGAIGILMDGNGTTSFAEILNNDIDGGSGSNSAGIEYWNAALPTLIRGNKVFGGFASNGQAWGMVGAGAATLDSNRVNTRAAPSTCTNGGSEFCGGIKSESANVTVINNVALGTSSAKSTGLLLGQYEGIATDIAVNSNVFGGCPMGAGGVISAALVLATGTCCGNAAKFGRIKNNVLLPGWDAAGRYGVYEVAQSGYTVHPKELKNNLVFLPSPSAVGVFLYGYWDAAAYKKAVTLTDLGNLGLPAQSGNLIADPKLDPTTFKQLSGSPCKDKGLLDMDTPKTDFDGEPRPSKAGSLPDIGADEAS